MLMTMTMTLVVVAAAVVEQLKLAAVLYGEPFAGAFVEKQKRKIVFISVVLSLNMFKHFVDEKTLNVQIHMLCIPDYYV